MKVLDISKWQPKVAYSKLDVDGVICRVGYGGKTGGVSDALYKTHAAGVRKAKLPLGHYWFNGPGSARDEAEYFVNHLQRFLPGDPLVLDIEGVHMYTPAKALEWIATVQRMIADANVWVYMSDSAVNSKWDAVLKQAKLWVARYGTNTGQIDTTHKPAHVGWRMWQYTSKGKVSGIAGNVDLSTGSDVWEKPAVKPKPIPQIDVDGKGGPATVTRLQTVLGTRVDGKITGQPLNAKPYHNALYAVAYGPGSSACVKALQKRLGMPQDGWLGPATIRAWQHELRVSATSHVDAATVRAIQKALNQGKAF